MQRLSSSLPPQRAAIRRTRRHLIGTTATIRSKLSELAEVVVAKAKTAIKPVEAEAALMQRYSISRSPCDFQFNPTLGGGGGSGGPNGAGSKPAAGVSTGGAADGSTVSGGAEASRGNSGTEFDPTHGSGSGEDPARRLRLPPDPAEVFTEEEVAAVIRKPAPIL
jgi:hypothetical protein